MTNETQFFLDTLDLHGITDNNINPATVLDLFLHENENEACECTRGSESMSETDCLKRLTMWLMISSLFVTFVFHAVQDDLWNYVVTHKLTYKPLFLQYLVLCGTHRKER